MPASNDVRHAVSRSTGATTWTRKEADGWKSTCLNHKAETTAPSRGVAWKNGSTPAQFCSACKKIVAGKAARITGPRLDLPTPTPRKSAANKSKATTTKKAATPSKKAS